ncbi:hypothetical protein SAMN02910317_01037 [Ruminococcaceae bacterium FB2012]|nr:hypothetical protein SAMN02910317_01037 [Ruminococcaceae bacterium FB2012]
MPKYLMPAIVFGVAAAAFWGIFLAGSSTKTIVLGAACAAMAVIFLLMFIMNTIGKGKLSGWKLFAFSDLGLIVVLGTLGAIELIISEDSASFGPGMLGAILLEYCLPVLGGLLLVEFFVYKTVKMYQSGESEQEPAPAEEKQLPQKIAYPPESPDKDVPKDE